MRSDVPERSRTRWTMPEVSWRRRWSHWKLSRPATRAMLWAFSDGLSWSVWYDPKDRRWCLGCVRCPVCVAHPLYLSQHAEALDIEPHVVFSKTGRLVWNDEVGVDISSFGFQCTGPVT